MSKINEKVVEYYNDIIKGAIDGQIKYALEHKTEGWHDCIVIDFQDCENLKCGENVFIPSIIAFYEYLDVDNCGDEISYRGGRVEDCYSFRDDGYGEGLYINKDNHREIFENVVALIDKNVNNDEYLENLWNEFLNIAIDGNNNIDSDFYIWNKGTAKNDIWLWFDRSHSKGLAEGLMGFANNESTWSRIEK